MIVLFKVIIDWKVYTIIVALFFYNCKLFFISGDLGKELKNLITLMDQDDDDSSGHSMRRNKESPVWTNKQEKIEKMCRTLKKVTFYVMTLWKK